MGGCRGEAWGDVVGYDAVKARLQRSVVWPIRHPGRLEAFGLQAPRGVLLHGPPGCGKSVFAEAVAALCRVPILAVKGPEIMSKYVGESEAEVRRLFHRARAQAPCVVFLDEIDAMAAARSFTGGDSGGSGVYERVLSTLLNEMDGIEAIPGVVIVGATTRVEAVDKALLRPGRFDECIEIGVPSVSDRLALLQLHVRRSPLAPDVDLESLAARCEGWTGADLAALSTEAAMRALRRDLETSAVCMADFQAAWGDLNTLRTPAPPLGGSAPFLFGPAGSK